MKKILMLCPNHRDYRELGNINRPNTSITFHQYSKALFVKEIKKKQQINHIELIKNIVHLDNQENFDAIVSTSDYPGTLLASIVNSIVKKKGATPSSVFSCEHKYYSRVIQQRIVPEATPSFGLIPYGANQAPTLNCPFFVKPIKSSFSQYANKVENKKLIKKIVRESTPPRAFTQPFEELAKAYSNLNPYTNFLLGEEFLSGKQVTLDGVVINGTIKLLGIVDSIMHANGISFQEFSYPSSLPKAIQKRMESVTKSLVTALKLNNTQFNIEFMYNSKKDTVHIIEVNPRMSSQFADLYEKVDGINSYQLLVNMALDKEIDIKKQKTSFSVASSFPLRIFSNQNVINVPSEYAVEMLLNELPDVRIEILAERGGKLSDTQQDGKSFCYGIVNAGGHNRKDLDDKFSYIKSKLSFAFEPIDR